ncbi:hypothetical protein EDB92DRAFT_1806569 [Lactarius akahatsu]|uniref:Uncharacterized protein n=1 Tax=Lactarius akahatsu TaxID=416441 RepID=A0AAD4L5X2_9AGAM|nr:hypothetical protein EDB92DRAFT_1806569 [Lactarius akahatsu]
MYTWTRDETDKQIRPIVQKDKNHNNCLCQLTILSSFANRSTRFITMYGEGLSGAQAAWANKKYHGHRTLPPEWVFTAKNSTV